MSKEEIALQLTMARLDKLANTACTGKPEDNVAKNQKFNEEIAIETYKLFNKIFDNIIIKE